MKVFATCALALLAATQVDALSCNYEGTLYPVCMNANAWSFENGRPCVGITRCVSQSPPYGISSLPPASKTPTPTPTPTGTTKTPTPTPTGTTTTPRPTGTTGPPAPRVENPFVDAKWYVDPIWAAKANGETGGSKISKFSTAVWMDRIGAIAPTEAGAWGMRSHLDACLSQGCNLIKVVVYDLPNRDCKALASNGELLIAQGGLARYKTEYVDALYSIFSDPKYASIKIIAIIEPDSLPNLVTNLDVPKCAEANQAGGYVEGTQYTLNKFYPLQNVYSYIDIGHSGWLGWEDNFTKATSLIATAIKGTTNGVKSINGFISCTANTTPLTEPFLDKFQGQTAMPGNAGSQVRQAKFYEWNMYFSELKFVQDWRTKMISLGFPSTIGMLVDTSRNGWGGPGRPTALSTSTVLDTFVDASRIDKRYHRGNWCNQDSGIGERPKAAPATGVHAYVWIKPPGESDGASSLELSYDPIDPNKGFDRFCDPTYIPSSSSQPTGATANAPVAGRWYPEQFIRLIEKAYPAL
jgi:cellulose 1,4-beta-cellobiosidase